MRAEEKILEEIEEEIQMKKAVWESLEKPPYNDLEQSLWIAGMRNAKDIICKHMNDGWIPVEKDQPKTDDYILLSFENFSLPLVGRYESNEEGGAFYLGDCYEEDTCISQDLYVNAWRPLPAPYRPETNNEN